MLGGIKLGLGLELTSPALPSRYATKRDKTAPSWDLDRILTGLSSGTPGSLSFTVDLVLRPRVHMLCLVSLEGAVPHDIGAGLRAATSCTAIVQTSI